MLIIFHNLKWTFQALKPRSSLLLYQSCCKAGAKTETLISQLSTKVQHPPSPTESPYQILRHNKSSRSISTRCRSTTAKLTSCSHLTRNHNPSLGATSPPSLRTTLKITTTTCRLESTISWSYRCRSRTKIWERSYESPLKEFFSCSRIWTCLEWRWRSTCPTSISLNRITGSWNTSSSNCS